MCADRQPINLENPQGSQVGDHNTQQNFFTGPRLVWTAGIISAVIVGSVLTIVSMRFVPLGGVAGAGAGPSSQASWAPSSARETGAAGAASSGTVTAAPAPFTVAVADHTTPCGTGWLIPDGSTAALPTPSISFDDEYRQWARQAGAVAVGTTMVELNIQGRSEAQVTLRTMRVKIVKRLQPVRGTAYGLAGCGGEGIYRWATADLDAPAPVLTSRVEDSIDPDDEAHRGPVTFPYKVALADTELFLISGTTQRCLCEWIIEIEWSSQGRSGVMVVDDQGQPFRTTAPTAAKTSCRKRPGEAISQATDCRPGSGR